MCNEAAQVEMSGSHRRDIVKAFHGSGHWERTGMPMKDFFACTTSPSTILAASYGTVKMKSKQRRIEWRGFDVMSSRCFADDEVVWVVKKECEGRLGSKGKALANPASNLRSRIIPRRAGTFRG